MFFTDYRWIGRERSNRKPGLDRLALIADFTSARTRGYPDNPAQRAPLGGLPIGQPAMKGKTMALYLSQERWGRVCLHFVAALRAGHWSWHLAGIEREMAWMWPRAHRASAAARG